MHGQPGSWKETAGTAVQETLQGLGRRPEGGPACENLDSLPRRLDLAL